MNRNRSFAVAFAALLACSVASLAHAAEVKDTTHPYTGAVTGQVTAVDAKSIAVKGPNDDGGSFAVNADTQIMNGDKNVKIADVKKGWNVVVSWDYAAVTRRARLRS